MKQALGLLEVKGLASAISAADVMVKSAAVELIGVERAKGFGWTTVKVVGDVGAVKASVEAGEAKSRQDSSFVSSKVIPRPGEGIADFFLPKEEKKPAIDSTKIKDIESDEIKEEPVVVEEKEVKAPPVKAATPPAKNARANNKKPPVKGGKK